MSARVVRVGDLGKALTPLGPSGVVELGGARLDARSEREFIPAGAAVVVLRGDPTGYVVRQVGPDHPFPTLPDAGTEVARPEFMRNSTEVRVAAARDEAVLRQQWERAAGVRLVAAAVLGATVGTGDVLLAGATRVGVVVAGGAIGLVTGALIAALVGRAGAALRWSPLAGLLAVFGGLIGAEAGFWAYAVGGAPPPPRSAPAHWPRSPARSSAGGWGGTSTFSAGRTPGGDAPPRRAGTIPG